MNFMLTGTENVPIYLAIAGLTFVFSFFLWMTIFAELDVYDIKYTKQVKRRSLWLIFSNLLSVIIWWQILQRLLTLLV